MTHHVHKPDETFNPLAAILAYALPGLGHAWLGHPRRGAYICLGVLGLFLGGMLIGGIDVVDRKDDKWWFVLQAGAGPVAWITDAIHQNVLKDPAPPHRTQSLGKVNEVGSLWAAMAGMLNAIAVVDCLWHAPRRRRRAADLAAPL